MEELHAEGLATHGDPESCAASREGRGEALAGRKATPLAALSRAARGPRAVRDPWHVRNLRAREPGGPVPARPRGLRAGRRGNAAAVSPGCTGAGSRISS